MKVKELRTKENAELNKILQDKKMELVKLRFDWKNKKLKNTNLIKETKKDIARILTILKERSNK